MNAPVTPIGSRLADLVGAEHRLMEAAELSAYALDGLTPQAVLRPGSTEEVAEILRFAKTERLAVIPMGARSKLGIGMPPRRYDLALDVTRMNRVLAYDPGDLTLGVEPGVRYADLARQLASKSQFLPLAPAYAERATIGGIVAAGADSPLRHGYGGIRDFLLGMEFVTGAGVASKSGGRVVKNVTGYDIHKLLVGSLGTLAVITRINFRTFPVPPERRIFIAWFADAAAALELCARVAQSQLQPRMVEAFNTGAAKRFAAGEPARGRWCVAIAAAGEPTAVARHERDLAALARETQTVGFETLDDVRGAALLAAISEFPRLILEKFPGAIIFRIATLPSAMAALAAQIAAIARRHECEAAVLVRAVGAVYAALLPSRANADDRLAACKEVMDAGNTNGGRSMIEWCPANVKREMSVWPAAGDNQALAQRLKNVFDPHGILAPGRFLGGI